MAHAVSFFSRGFVAFLVDANGADAFQMQVVDVLRFRLLLTVILKSAR